MDKEGRRSVRSNLLLLNVATCWKEDEKEEEEKSIPHTRRGLISAVQCPRAKTRPPHTFPAAAAAATTKTVTSHKFRWKS